MAIANIYQSLQQGIRVFDSSLAGLGGCPYAKGASGNVSTEDLFYLLSHMGFETGIDLEKLMQASQNISNVLNRKACRIMQMRIGKPSMPNHKLK